MASAAPLAPARGAHRALPPPSLRVVAMVAASVALLVIILVAWLVTSTQILNSAAEDLVRDGRRIVYLERVESSLLSYQRLSNALGISPESELARREELDRIAELLARAEATSTGSTDRQQVLAIQSEIEEYVTMRHALEQRGASLDEIVAETRAPLNAVLWDLDETQRRYLDDLRRSEQRTALITRRASIQGGAVIVLVVLGMVLAAFLFRAHVVDPLEKVRAAILEFRASGKATAAEEKGPVEIREIARTLNETTKALAEDRKRQLAFVAGVAHDLKSPLTALTLAVSLLEEVPPGAQGEALRARAMRQIAGNSERLRRMVEDLMDVTRSEASELALDLTDLDLRCCVRDVVDMHFVETGTHTLTLAVPDEPVLVRADHARIDQVLVNLVSNAMKYSPGGGEIRIALERTATDAVLSVSDHGVGIPEDEVPMLFEPFHRGTVSRHVAPGAGLGLSILARIVHAHGGRVEVESKLGEGSTFRVILPLANA